MKKRLTAEINQVFQFAMFIINFNRHHTILNPYDIKMVKMQKEAVKIKVAIS